MPEALTARGRTPERDVGQASTPARGVYAPLLLFSTQARQPDVDVVSMRIAVSAKTKWCCAVSPVSHRSGLLPHAANRVAFPASHRKRPRTSNLLERMNKELRRRTLSNHHGS